jgi:hypothetical protein
VLPGTDAAALGLIRPDRYSTVELVAILLVTLVVQAWWAVIAQLRDTMHGAKVLDCFEASAPGRVGCAS